MRPSLECDHNLNHSSSPCIIFELLANEFRRLSRTLLQVFRDVVIDSDLRIVILTNEQILKLMEKNLVNIFELSYFLKTCKVLIEFDDEHDVMTSRKL